MWKISLTVALNITILLVLLSGSACAERQVVVNIPAFTLYVYDEGVPIKTYPISIGTELNPSVLGETTVINKVVNPIYYPAKNGTPILPGPENPVGTRWLGLGFPGYGIHGTNNPASIGSAASLGCIRMQNEDVEELTELVQVGTKVRLIYQTVLIHEDPLLHTKSITVYPDVYKQGVSPGQLQEELARLNLGEVFWPALLTLLKVPSGKPYPLAWAWPLSLNGQITDLVAAEWQEEFYVPFDVPFDPRSDFAIDTVKWGESYYVPLSAYLELTGLGYSKTQGELLLHSPVAYLDEQSLGPAMVYRNELYISAADPSYQLIPTSMQVLKLWGDIYQPARIVVDKELWGQLRLEWPEGSFTPSCW